MESGGGSNGAGTSDRDRGEGFSGADTDRGFGGRGTPGGAPAVGDFSPGFGSAYDRAVAQAREAAAAQSQSFGIDDDLADEAAGLGIGGAYGGGGLIGRADRSAYGEPMSAPPGVTVDWGKAAPGLIAGTLSAVTGNPIGAALGFGRAAYSGLGTNAGQSMGPGQGNYGGFYGGQPSASAPGGPAPGAPDPGVAALHRSLYDNPDLERFQRPQQDSFARAVFGAGPLSRRT